MGDHIVQGGKYDGGLFDFPYTNDAYERAFRVLKYVFDSLADRDSFFAGLLDSRRAQRNAHTSSIIPNDSSPSPQCKSLRQRMSSSNNYSHDTLSEASGSRHRQDQLATRSSESLAAQDFRHSNHCTTSISYGNHNPERLTTQLGPDDMPHPFVDHIGSETPGSIHTGLPRSSTAYISQGTSAHIDHIEVLDKLLG